jgi:hypothetical protein
MRNKKHTGLMRQALALLFILFALTSFAKAQGKKVEYQEKKNKEIVVKWLDNFWGSNYNPAIVVELASPECSCKIRFTNQEKEMPTSGTS